MKVKKAIESGRNIFRPMDMLVGDKIPLDHACGCVFSVENHPSIRASRLTKLMLVLPYRR